MASLTGRGWLASWTLFAAFSLALSGCTTDAPDRDDESPSSGAASEGPLVVLTEPGSKAAYAPSRTPYYYTQGFLICRDDGSTDDVPTLRSISYDVRLRPLEVRPVIRRIPEAADRKGPPGGWAPILDALGRPGDFDGAPVRGDFSYDLDGTDVTASCADASEADSAKMELEIVMKVPNDGADIDGFTITYDVGGEAHEVHVPWRLVGCGAKVDRELCTRG